MMMDPYSGMHLTEALIRAGSDRSAATGPRGEILSL